MRAARPARRPKRANASAHGDPRGRPARIQIILSAGPRASTPVTHNEIWRDATRYIDAHLDRPLNLPEIARAALTSERQLQRVFATVGDTTVREYLLRARMRRATELLLDTGATVTEVAGAVGYGHVSAFIKAFRTHHGFTPTELRRTGPV